LIASDLPKFPNSEALLAPMIFGEVLIGVFLGTIARLFVAALTTTGMVIAYMSTMANALVNDPSAAQQGSIVGSFLAVTAVLLIFTLDLYHLILMAVVDSYELFAPGQVPPAGDFSEMITRVVARATLLSYQIATPFVGVGRFFFLGLAPLGRLMPQMQVFVVAMPVQIAAGLFVLAIALPSMLRWFAGDFEETLLFFIAP